MVEDGVGNKCEWLLCHGVKNLLRCDDAETVRGIAQYVMLQYRVLGVGSRFMESRRQTKIPPFAAFLGAVTRFLEPRLPKNSDGAVWIARLDNERRALEILPPLLPELNWTELKFARQPELAGVISLKHKLLPHRRRIKKLASTLLRGRHDFFKVLRVAELIGYYISFLDTFERGNFKLAVMSSHSNPHGIAFNLAARKCKIPVVLITHGMPVRPVARLHYDLAVVHCEAARQTYLAEGCQMNQVIVYGQKQNYVKMPNVLPTRNLTVGIFLCKDVNEKSLQILIKRLFNNQRVTGIIIRSHPKNLWLKLNDWIVSLGDSRVRRSICDAASDDLKTVDIVLGGNSSVLIEAVTAGRPSGYVPHLDYGSTDLHRFVEEKLIYPVDDNFDPERMLKFYQHPDWLNVLRLFADIERNEKTVADEIELVLRELVARRRKSFLNNEIPKDVVA